MQSILLKQTKLALVDLDCHPWPPNLLVRKLGDHVGVDDVPARNL